MASKYSVLLKTVAKEAGLKPVHKASNFENAQINAIEVNRPALQLTGFYDYFDPKRVQIIGMVESTYLESIGAEARLKAFDEFMSYEISALVIAHGATIFPECIAMAEKYDRTVLYTDEDTMEFISNIIGILHSYLAPRKTIHGVLVEIYGEGVLLMGDSGIGKSETALELIKRGHRLIADDAVEIKLIDKNTLVGSAPEMIRYYMELRGIGVINVRHIYGVGAVKPEGNINLVVNMERWVRGKMYDRLGLNDEYEDILGVKVPSVTIPVEAGRNLAVILELAAMNNRQKNLGYNAAMALAEAHDSAIDNGMF